jgi:hypothetical protein
MAKLVVTQVASTIARPGDLAAAGTTAVEASVDIHDDLTISSGRAIGSSVLGARRCTLVESTFGLRRATAFHVSVRLGGLPTTAAPVIAATTAEQQNQNNDQNDQLSSTHGLQLP